MLFDDAAAGAAIISTPILLQCQKKDRYMKKDTENKRNFAEKFLIFIVIILLAAGGFLVWKHLKKSEVPAEFGKLEVASGNVKCVVPNEKFTITIQAVNAQGTPFKNCRIDVQPKETNS